jgi:hypothetical protein
MPRSGIDFETLRQLGGSAGHDLGAAYLLWPEAS